MALSWEEFSAVDGQATVAVNIDYLDKSDIHLEVNDVEVTGFTWASTTLINIPNTITVAAGDKLAIVRKTDRSVLRLLFSEGAAFTRDNIDEQNDQFLYLAQELVEGRSIDGFYGDISMNGYRITSLGNPISAEDATNKEYVDIQDAKVVAQLVAGDLVLSNQLKGETSARQKADASLQAQITNQKPLEGSAFSPISWHDQHVSNSTDIPANKNAWSFGPTMTVDAGQVVTVGQNSTWTIANGAIINE